MRVKVTGYHSLEDAYRQAVKATQELKRANDRTRYQRQTPPNNYNRNNVRPPNNNNNIGNNRQDLYRRRRIVQTIRDKILYYVTIVKKPGHLIKDLIKERRNIRNITHSKPE